MCRESPRRGWSFRCRYGYSRPRPIGAPSRLAPSLWGRPPEPSGCREPGEQLEDAGAGEHGGDIWRCMVADDGKEQIRQLREKIGELTMERDFLSGALGKFPGLSGKR